MPTTGTPIWFELATADAAQAQDFYAALMDWRFTTSEAPEHGGYRMGGPSAEVPVAGVMQSAANAGGMPGWMVYFASDDVDADAARVSALGGRVAFEPADIPYVGRFAVVADPQGVTFALMKQAAPGDYAAFSQMGGATGHGVWIELATPDPDAALGFYGALFGWEKAGAMPMGEMGDYTFIGDGKDGGLRPGAIMSSATTGASARWNWYVHVADVDAAIATGAAGGGTLLQGPDEIPGGDFSAHLADPAGHQIGIVGPRKAGAAA